MKKLFCTLLILFSIITVFGQSTVGSTQATSKSFPTNLSPENFQSLSQFNGKIVTFDGVISRIENSRNNTPFYRLQLDSTNYLWTVLMFKNEGNQIGDTIRVVGYLREATALNKKEKKYLDAAYMVIAFGLVDFSKPNLMFIRGAEIQKQEWIEGKIPTSK